VTVARPHDVRLYDPAYLQRRYVDDQVAIDAFARELHVGRPRLTQALTDAGIPLRRRGRPQREALADRDLLYRRYVVDGLSVLDLAGELHVARATLRKALAEAGIPRSRSGRRVRHVILDDCEWLRGRYEDDGMSIGAVARQLEVSDDSVRRALEHHGIPRRDRGGQIAHPNLEDIGWLTRLYVDERRTQAEIAAVLEVDKAAVQRAVKRLGVRR
jgi:AraC-like DNA-binding protein